jgi:hypothetical protein
MPARAISWAAISALSRCLSLLLIGIRKRFAKATPYRVAMKARATAPPMREGSASSSRARISPRTVPMIPRVGLKPPQVRKNSSPCRWRACIPSISMVRICRIVSGSFPSTTSWSPFRRNRSGISSISRSSVRRPFLRALSAIRTRVSRVSRGSSVSERKARRSTRGILRAVLIRKETRVAPRDPPTTMSSAENWKSEAIRPPSMANPATSSPQAATRPNAVARSMLVLLSPAESRAVRSRGEPPRWSDSTPVPAGKPSHPPTIPNEAPPS